MGIRLFLLMLLILSATSAQALDVTMTATASDDLAVVTGRTNLPDGTELLVTLSDAEGVYRAEGKVTVTGGAFRTGPISPPHSRECTLNVITQIAVYQPEKVRSIIGDCGEMLAGRFVVKGSFGGLIVSYHDRVVLSRKAEQRRKRIPPKPKAVVQRKVPPQRKAPSFNRYSSYCALKAAGRKDLPPITDTMMFR